MACTGIDGLRRSPARRRSPVRGAACRRSRRACSRPPPPRRPARRRCPRGSFAARASASCALRDRLLRARRLVRAERGDVLAHLLRVGLRLRRPRAAVLVDAVGVDADDGLRARLDCRLEPARRFADLLLHDAGGDGRVHAAGVLDDAHRAQDLRFHLVGQRLDVVAAAERVDHVGQVRFLAQDVLRGHRDARAELGRAGQRLVVRVGVQRLQAAEDAGHRLHGDAGDVVERLLPREIDAGGLRVELEAPAPRVLRAVALARQPRPDAPPGAEARDLLEERQRDVEEEREARQELVRIHAARDAVVGVLQRRGEREGHRLGRRGAGLLHVLADDRHRVPLRDVPVAEVDVVAEDPPRARQRDAEEHVVGDVVAEVVALVRRAADRVPADAAPLRGGQQEREQRERRGIVHRARGLPEVDAGEAGVHVLDGVDDHAAGAEELRVHLVHVVAAVHRVARNERHRVAALRDDVEQPRVVVGRRAEPDQLALRPRPAAVHRRVDAARVGRLARIADLVRRSARRSSRAACTAA